jgi:hypothetical protein
MSYKYIWQLLSLNRDSACTIPAASLYIDSSVPGLIT